jgi:hypothetical protein
MHSVADLPGGIGGIAVRAQNQRHVREPPRHLKKGPPRGRLGGGTARVILDITHHATTVNQSFSCGWSSNEIRPPTASSDPQYARAMTRLMIITRREWRSSCASKKRPRMSGTPSAAK